MADVRRKNFDQPDEVVDVPGVHVQIVDVGDLTVGRMVNEPGWRWSTHMRPVVGGEWCVARHVGLILSGRLGTEFPDGTSVEFGPGDVFDIPPGHDGFTIGDEPCVQVEWMGLRAWAGFPPTPTISASCWVHQRPAILRRSFNMQRRSLAANQSPKKA